METPQTYTSPTFTTTNPAANYSLLTKREYFAATALQGLLAGGQVKGLNATIYAALAIAIADELIDQLNTNK